MDDIEESVSVGSSNSKRSLLKLRNLNAFQKRPIRDKRCEVIGRMPSVAPAAAAAKADAAKKSLEVNAFQIECETEIQWKKLLRRDGLILVDVYSSWSGPCIAMINTLKRIKVEINNEHLWYALAQTDDISDLHMFHDQSEPCWLFIGGGKPVKVFRGTNVPQFTALIKSEFEREMLCLGGKAKRNIISIDDEVSRRRKAEAEAESLMSYMKDEDEIAEEMNAVRRDSSIRLMHTLESYTVLVVQNYLLATGALTEIRDELYGEFNIEHERTVNLNEKRARELFRIPYEIPDPNQPTEALITFTSPPPSFGPPPGEDASDDLPPAEEDVAKAMGLMLKTIPVPVPPEILGETHIMLIEAIDLKKMMKQGKRPAATSPLQTAEDYIQVKVGPINYEDALEHAPNSFHAAYGRGENIPGVWCPRRYDDKRYVMITYFPRFVTEMLSPPTDTGPEYMVAVFPVSKTPEVNLNMEFHREDVLATATMKLPPEVIEEMIGSYGYPKDSEAYSAKKEKINGDVYVISVNKTNSSLGLAIRALDPIHTSYDKTTGKLESGKLFTDLGINLGDIPNADEVVSKFLARSRKRPTSITQLAKVALSKVASVVSSGVQLAVAPSDSDFESEMEGEMEEGEGEEETRAGPPLDELPVDHDDAAADMAAVSETDMEEEAPAEMQHETDGEGGEEAEEE